jgi:hypothetical protein
MSNDALRDAAIQYAKMGWHIFPLGFKSKMPAISKADGGNGLNDATNDIARIERYWNNHPSCNIGVNVGASNLYVVDVDGERGESSLEDLLKEHGPFPDTLIAITGKGFHYFFKMPEGLSLGNTASSLGPGIDTRGVGGYVVAPPSLHPDGCLYEWKEEGLACAELPKWILDKVQKPVYLPPTYTPSIYSINVHPYVRRVWEGVQVTLRSAQHGERNNALNIAAVKMGHWIASNSIDRGRVEQELTLIAQDLGLADLEIQKTMESGIEAGMKIPAYPPDNRQFQHENTSQSDARVSEGVISIQRGSSFGRKEVKYLWGKRIPIGMLTVLAGPSGIGKSFISLALAANITAGVPLLDEGTHVDGEVLFCSYEDEVESTIGPRADGLGVDLDRCHFITGVTTEHGERQFGPQDVPRIIDFLKGCPQLKLIVIDPLGSFLGGGVDVNSENEARAVLGTLVKAASETDTAVLMVAHFNKGSDSPDPLHRIAGSQGITALPRSVLAVEWGEDKERLVKHLKSSTSAEAPTIGYHFDGKFNWTRIIREASQCKDWLQRTLRLAGGTMAVDEIYEKARMYGLTDDELDLARDMVDPIIDAPPQYTKGKPATWTLR